MSSHEDYLDSLLKNLENDSTNLNNIDEDESFTGGQDDDDLIQSAVSDLEAALDSDDNLKLEKLLGLGHAEVVQKDEELPESSLPEDTAAELTAMLEREGAVHERETLAGIDMASKEGSGSKKDAVPDLEALSSMSEDEIDRLLSAGSMGDSESGGKGISFDDDDLLSFLDDIEDDDPQDIQDMLHRVDNNEAVDEPLLRKNTGKKLSRLSDGEDDPQNMLSEKEKRAQQKKLRKQKRAEAKAAAKAAKAAAKAAKAAAKAAKKGTAAAGGVPEKGPVEGTSPTGEKNEPVGNLFDTSLLDSIVAAAEQAGTEGKTTAVQEGTKDVSSSENTGESSASQDGSGQDQFDFNMDSMLEGDEGTDSSDQNDPNFSDFVAVDVEEADALIPEYEAPAPPKKGLFTKILDMLSEEDEESASLKLSEENRDILNDLDNEKADEKKKKKNASGDGKKGKEKKSKAKKSKAKKAAKPKKPKKPKPAKPKKEKVPEPEPLIPERKLTLKKVMPIVLVGVSLGVLIIVFTNASVDYTAKQTAREAYDAGDYQTCFQNLYGKNLNETEQLMYGKSESILYIRLWLREYEMFTEEGSEVEALDSLIQTVHDYPKLYDYAIQWDAETEVAAGYQRILNILLEKYGLSEEQAKEIAAVHSDRDYTRIVVGIVQGNGFGSLNEETPVSETEQQNPASESDQTTLQDVLPEEEELGENDFLGN